MRLNKGETLSAFNRRVDRAHADKVVTAGRSALRVTEKRKEYTAKKKKSIKDKKASRLEEREFDSRLEKKEVIKFGEVAMAPPTFTAKPRGTPFKNTLVFFMFSFIYVY